MCVAGKRGFFLDEEHNNTREIPYIERARGGIL
jgi:hypothetical protein